MYASKPVVLSWWFSHYIEHEKSLLLCQFELTVIYITEQVRNLHLRCGQRSYYKRRFAPGDTMLVCDIIFRKLSKGFILI